MSRLGSRAEYLAGDAGDRCGVAEVLEPLPDDVGGVPGHGHQLAVQGEEGGQGGGEGGQLAGGERLQGGGEHEGAVVAERAGQG